MLDKNKLKKPFIELQSLRKKEFTYPERFDVGNNIINAIITYHDAILSTLDEDQKENYPFKKNYNFGEADKIINEYLEKFHKIVTKVPTKNLGSRIYAPLEEKKIETGNGLEEFTIKHAPKSELFEQAFNKVFLGGEIYIDYENKFEEALDEHQMRKFPYIIYHIKSSDPKKSKTILISDQVGEATFVYPGLIDISRFRDNGITKESDIDGLLPIKVIFSKNYEKRIIDIIQVDNDDINKGNNGNEGDNGSSLNNKEGDYKQEMDYFNQLESIKGFLANPVDESGNPITIDLKTIGINKFSKIKFNYSGENISSYVLLRRNGFNRDIMGLKGLLSLIGIDRDDIQEVVKLEDFEDYKKYFEGNKEKFVEFGCKFSEKDGKNVVDLNNIGNPQKFKLFGIGAGSSLKNLGNALGVGSGEEVKNKEEAQKVLKVFFEKMGYEVVENK